MLVLELIGIYFYTYDPFEKKKSNFIQFDGYFYVLKTNKQTKKLRGNGF